MTNFDVTDGINGAVISSGFYQPEANSSDLLVFSGLAANSNNEITFRVNAPATSGSGTVNFIQIDVVPEPSSALLIVLTVMGAACRRRRP